MATELWVKGNFGAKSQDVRRGSREIRGDMKGVILLKQVHHLEITLTAAF